VDTVTTTPPPPPHAAQPQAVSEWAGAVVPALPQVLPAGELGRRGMLVDQHGIDRAAHLVRAAAAVKDKKTRVISYLYAKLLWVFYFIYLFIFFIYFFSFGW
jgi:hypothetical protein